MEITHFNRPVLRNRGIGGKWGRLPTAGSRVKRTQGAGKWAQNGVRRTEEFKYKQARMTSGKNILIIEIQIIISLFHSLHRAWY